MRVQVNAAVVALLCLAAARPAAGRQESAGADLATRALEIERLVFPHEAAELLSGTILVARGEQVLYRGRYGYANWELREPVNPSTRFGIGSITKAMTEIVVRSLAAEGRLDLDAPVDRYLDGFPAGPAGGKPTIRHLLVHRAGVPHRVTADAEEATVLRPAAVVERVRAAGLLFEPGSRRQYSSAGYTVLARVVEVVTGRPFADVLAERVFEPAGMRGATEETGRGLMTGRAAPYLLGVDAGRLAVEAAPYKDLRFLTGAGSVYATADDLLRFMRALRAGVFGAELAAEMYGGDPGAWVGLAGRTGGYEASVDLLPGADLTIVFLSNLRSATNWQLRERLRTLLEGGTAEPIPLPPPVAPAFEDPAALLGDYGPAEIVLRDDQLYRGDSEFHPIAGNAYYIPLSGTRMRFRRDTNGVVDALISIDGSGNESVLPRTHR